MSWWDIGLVGVFKERERKGWKEEGERKGRESRGEEEGGKEWELEITTHLLFVVGSE